MKTLPRILFVVAVALTTLWTYMVPDAQNFRYPAMARIFFWHFPCPMMLLTFMFAGIYFSFRVFRGIDQKFTPVEDAYQRMQWDIRAEAAMEIGFVWAVLTMITGILFSLVQWGAWWQWDPRQTSFLLALLIYGAYFALRNSFSDLDKRAQFLAAYCLAAAAPIFFLVLVFPHLPQVEAVSFHPSDTIMGGQLKGQYLYVTLVMLTIMTIISIWLYRMRTKVNLYALKLDFKHGKLEISGRGAAPTSVVRPLNLSREDGSPNEGA